jgi:hypothetical protein
LLAEHGLFGLAAILLLLSIVVHEVRRGHDGQSKGLSAGMMFWCLVEMTHAAMRIAAISYFFA